MPEKVLGTMRFGPLFKDDARLCEVLSAVPAPPSLLSRQPLDEVEPGRLQRVGDGNLLLVLENSATWSSIVNNLPLRHNVGHVAIYPARNALRILTGLVPCQRSPIEGHRGEPVWVCPA